MSNQTTCPVCLGAHGATASCCAGKLDDIACTACDFYVIDTATSTRLLSGAEDLSTPERAALSHTLRTRINLPISRRGGEPLLNNKSLRDLQRQGLQPPSADEQARNLIRLLGNHKRMTDEPLVSNDPAFYAAVGALSPPEALEIARRVERRGLLRLEYPADVELVPKGDAELTLTPAGLAEWRAIRRGRRSSNRALIVANLGSDDILERILDVEQAVEAAAGMSLDRHDSSDVHGSDTMSAAIENAALVFVAVEDERSWAGGYAEGLGKPVIYLRGDGPDNVGLFQNSPADEEDWFLGPPIPSWLNMVVKMALAGGGGDV